jgi:amino acid transporter
MLTPHAHAAVRVADSEPAAMTARVADRPAPEIRGADRLLVRAIGMRQLSTIIFAYTVGTGIFVLPAVVAAELGAAGVLAYLLCTIVIALVVLVFAEVGSRVTITGGPYAYVEASLGGFTAVTTSVLLVISDLTAAAAVATVLAGSLARAVGIAGAAPTDAIAVTLLAAIAAMNIRGVKTGAAVVEAFNAAKLVPLLLLVAAGAFFVDPANLRWTSVPSLAAVARTSGTLFFAFTGIESALVPSGEVRDPVRTVPRAALIAMALVALLYVAVQTVSVGVLGEASLAADRVAPLAAVAEHLAGSAGRTLLLAAVVVSTFGWLTGSTLATPRSLFALGRDGFLPAAFARVHPRFHTPHVAIIAFAVVVAALALTGSFQRLAVLSSLTSLAVYALCAIALLVLRRRQAGERHRGFQIPGGAAIPVLAVVACGGVALATVGVGEYELAAVVLVISAILYFFRRTR